ncbi:hypothetical protein [Caulobacter zeae]|uniref:hypothetical protein n=1 Tax=Caulobacter zeae TaxID=2055137 RepID=UPI001054B678|nr:hypothetical protein [Caulobacter zeae]
MTEAARVLSPALSAPSLDQGLELLGRHVALHDQGVGGPGGIATEDEVLPTGRSTDGGFVNTLDDATFGRCKPVRPHCRLGSRLQLALAFLSRLPPAKGQRQHYE